MTNSKSGNSDWINPYTKLRWQHKYIEGYISVIIPVYKEFKGLDVTLKSLQKQNYDASLFEIIVANDGAFPEITKIAKKYNAVVVEISPNMGSYFARNRAIENSQGEFLAFIDSDMSVPSNWLGSGIGKLQYADYVAGNVMIDQTSVWTSAHLYELFNAFPIKQYFERYHSGVTANLFVRRSVFLKSGGFDQRLRSGGDVEFGNRVYRLGFNQEYMESPVGLHPPRDYGELIGKNKRVIKGARNLSLLYPDRFGRFDPTDSLWNFFRKLGNFIPPTPKEFKQTFPERRKFHISELYFLLCKIKFLRGWYFFFFAISIRKFQSGLMHSSPSIKVIK
jgi:glycosyltransferase involved in cell wall biosynthesis